MGLLFDLMAKLTLDSSEYEKGLDSALGKITSIGGTIAKVGTAAVGAAAAGIVAFSKDAIQAAGTYETSFAQLQTIMDTTAVSADTMSAGLMEMSSRMGVSASELAETTYNAISATGDTAGSLSIVENATKLATAGFTDTSSALSVLTTAMNSYKMSAEETAGISDSLIAVQNLGVTTVAELSSSMGKAIASASAYSVDLYNLESAYVSLTKSGINTAESTTYISSMMKELGSDSTAVAKLVKQKTGKSFADLMKDGKSLGDVLGVLNDAVDGDANALMNLWSSAEAGKASNAILSQGLSEFNDNLANIRDSAGLTENAYSIMTDTFQHKTDMLKTNFENLQIAFGQGLIPGIGEIVDTVTGGIGEITAAVQAGDWGAAFDALGTTLGNVVNKIVEYAPQLVSAAISLLQSLGSALIENAPQLMDSAMAIVTELVNGLAQMAPSILPAAATLIVELANALTNPDTLSNILQGALGIITGLADGLIQAVGILAQAAPEIINNLVTFIVANLPMIIQTGLTLIQTLTEGIIQNLAPLMTGAIEIITALYNGILQMLPDLIPLGFEAVITLVSAIIDNLPEILDAGVQVLESLVEGILSAIDNLLDAGIELVSQLFTTIVDAAKDLIDAGKEMIGKIKEGFDEKVAEAKEWAHDLISNFVGGLREKWDKLKSTVSNIAGSIKSFLGFSEPEEGPLSNFHTYAPDMMDLFMKGIRDNEGALQAQVAHTFDFRDAITQPEAMTYTAPVTDTETDKTDALLAAIDDLKNAILNHTIELDGDVVANAVNRRLGDAYYGARRRNA